MKVAEHFKTCGRGNTTRIQHTDVGMLDLLYIVLEKKQINKTKNTVTSSFRTLMFSPSALQISQIFNFFKIFHPLSATHCHTYFSK